MKISKSLRISEKPPGMTLAEALGIIVPDNATGGTSLRAAEGRQGSSRRRDSVGTELKYEGFHDVDAYRRADNSS